MNFRPAYVISCSLQIKNSKISKNFKFLKFQESYVIKQLLHLNLINMKKKQLKKTVKCNILWHCDIIYLFTGYEDNKLAIVRIASK